MHIGVLHWTVTMKRIAKRTEKCYVLYIINMRKNE